MGRFEELIGFNQAKLPTLRENSNLKAKTG
jgi:hypothetical protein